jgi:phytoene/squalene synthetase
MSTHVAVIDHIYSSLDEPRADAAAMTRAASAQTYYTIRLLADRDRAADAYRAYAYFRWVDDRVDGSTDDRADQAVFLRRQAALLEAGYRDRMPTDLCPEERLLVELIAGDQEPESGLQVYLRNMMAVMAFDQTRRGRLVSAAELETYTTLLATAVMEALLYFIGHGCCAPAGEWRYLAVRGAHIIHMLRDMVEDTVGGYYNIPAEYLAAHGISIHDRDHPAYRAWVAGRVAEARDCFRRGRAFIAQVENPRCRLAGYAYIARFEWMARVIERDGYRLRVEYPERKSPAAGLWMVWRTVSSLSGLKIEIRP